MTSRDFVYWLQGYFEISDATKLTSKQVEVVKNHLAMVFIHEIDPQIEETTNGSVLDGLHSPDGSTTYRC